MSVRWKDIRRLRQCPFCHHGMRFHRHSKDLSELLDADIWHCQSCKTSGQHCSAKGVVKNKKGRSMKKTKEPFEGGGL